MSLTDLLIKRLKAPEKGQKTYYDDALPGFGVRVSQGGSKSFVVLYGRDRRRRTLGKYPDLKLAEARKLAKQAQVDVMFEEEHPSLPPMTFDEARRKFLDDCEARNRPKTVVEYRRLLHRHFTFKGDLSSITRRDVARAVEKINARPSEQHHAFVAIRTMMNWCVKRAVLEHSPVPAMSFKTTARDRILSDEEIVIVWQRADEIGYPYGRIIQLLLLTGQRRGEIVGLRRSWVSDDEIAYPREFVKNGRPHRVPLTERVRSLLDGLPEKSDLFFPSRLDASKPFNGFSKCKRTFDKEINVEPFTLHDLRRTFSSSLARLGTPIHITERLLNHTSGTISGVAAVYNRHSYLPEMREALISYEQFLEDLTQ
ncbi:integrase [Jannaschia pagri]|uniref:Integrase n=1 Tax=Jannaschia pagri TaxID=2829797 RepID=A0ABQ4NH03_9RHOB|nr:MULTISPECIES: site-specific integrase [unclassified Jannaschia]GIT90193.1 integrase [Jannaschia sp. AI_61]GIT93701.1 integrase [Jannaschia sp. AI_62]